MVNCQYCNQEFETVRKCSCHERLCKQRPDYEERLKRFKAGCGKSKGKQLVKRFDYDLVCDVCGKHYTKTLTESEFKRLKFFNCSRACANGHKHSDETKEKIRTSILKYCKDNNKERIQKYCKNTPDWIINNEYVEIKGYWNIQWQAKLDQFPKEEKLLVLTKTEMQPYIDYVVKKYGKDYIKLYE